MRQSLKVIFAVTFVLLFNFVPTVSQTSKINNKTLTSESLRPYTIPIRSIDPTDEDFSDLMPLAKKIGKSQIVVLGEATHSEGTAGRAKARMVKFLHQKMGFDVLVWEGGLMQGYLSNAAFKNESVPLPQAKSYLFSGGWTNEEGLQPMFEYTRASWKTNHPLEMSGFDNGKPRAAAKLFRNYLAEFIKKEPSFELSKEERALVENFTERGYGFINDKKIPEEERAGGRTVLQNLLQKIKSQHKNLTKKFSEREIDIIEHYINDAIISKNLSELFKVNNLEWNRQRDKFMSENIEWLAKVFYPNRKIIIYCATVHLIRNSQSIDPQSGKKWQAKQAGDYIYPKFKNKLYTIAITSYDGKIGDILPEEYGIPTSVEETIPAPENSFEAVAHQLGKPYLFVDLRSSPKSHWLHNSYISLALGRDINTAPWSQLVDAFFFIDQAEPIRYIRRKK